MGCALFITLSVFAYFIEKLDGVVLQVGILMIVLFAEIAWVQVEYNAMKKKMIELSKNVIQTGKKLLKWHQDILNR